MDLNFPSPSAPRQDVSVLHQMVDRQHHNVVAAVFQHPADWQARSEIIWNMQHMSLPARGYAQVCAPQDIACLEFLPVEMFFWIEPNMGFYPKGQEVQGCYCMPPMSAQDALARWVAPRLRGRMPGARIGQPAATPFVQQNGLDMKGLPYEEASIAIEYMENGLVMEEELYGVKTRQDVPDYGPMGVLMQTNWGFLRLYSMRAQKGKLSAYRETFWQIIRSAKANPAWEQLYAQVCQQIAAQFNQYLQMGYDRIYAAGQLSRTISANNDAMLANFAHQRQAAHVSHASSHTGSGRTTHDDFSDMMRGVETVEDPYWGESQQDNNYLYHWTDGQGNYQHSDDPYFNPSIGSNFDWTIMTPKTR